MYRSLVINLDHDNETYEIYAEVHIQPAEPDVGISSAYIDEICPGKIINESGEVANDEIHKLMDTDFILNNSDDDILETIKRDDQERKDFHECERADALRKERKSNRP